MQQKSYNIVDVAKDMLTGKAEYVSAEEQQQRLEQCKRCDKFVKLMNVCNQCGCYMPAKTKFKMASCPLEKW